MVADGLTAGLLVLLTAAIVERPGTSSLRAMGGMAGRMGKGAVLWIFAALAAIGFPGLAGFVGQLLIAVGAYPSHRIATPLALLGVVVVAGALIVTVQRVFFGAISERHGRGRDPGALELGSTLRLVSPIVFIRLLP